MTFSDWMFSGGGFVVGATCVVAYAKATNQKIDWSRPWAYRKRLTTRLR